MGFMTELSLLNDAWHAIERNPTQLVDAIKRGMNGAPGDTHGIHDGNSVYANPITTFPSHHADDPRVYIAWQNSFKSLDQYIVSTQYGERLEEVKPVLLRDVELGLARLRELKRFLQGGKA